MKWADKSVQEAYEGELVLLESARLVGLLILVFARSSFISQVGKSQYTCRQLYTIQLYTVVHTYIIMMRIHTYSTYRYMI